MTPMDMPPPTGGNDPDTADRDAMLFKARLLEKIEHLLDEFAMGKLSREQFNLLYERYTARLSITDYAIMSGNPDAIAIAQTGPSTLDIRAGTEGKAQGMVVYHPPSGEMLEMLGNFTVPPGQVLTLLRDFSQGAGSRPGAEPALHSLAARVWIALLARNFTAVAVQFENEPSRQQIRAIEKMLQDFEQANRHFLSEEVVDPAQLAYPFLVFVQKRIKK